MRLVERWEGGECTPVMKSDIDKNVHKEKCHEIKVLSGKVKLHYWT